jgi:GAF domain-containing protein
MLRPEGRPDEVRKMSATPDSTLANPEQFIADLQRQLAECRAERDEALRRETATAEVLQAINSSAGNLTPVFDAILEKATQLCEAPFGVLRTWDGERFHLAAVQGDPEFTEWARGYGPFAPADPSSPAGRIVSGEEVVPFADAPEEESLGISPGFRALVEAGGMRSGVTVALRKDDALLGNITVYRQEVRPFTDKQIALLQNFAAQAVIAMENARLLTETREALEQQTATAEVLQVINSSPGDLSPVFDAILEKAHNLCSAPYGSLQVFDGEQFRAAATRGLPEAFAELLRGGYRPFPGSPAEPLLNGEHCVHIVDMAALMADSTPAVAHRLQLSVDLAGTRTLLLVPLRKDGVLLGCIGAYRKEVLPFTDLQIALLQNFASQAVIAIENARLLTETREALEQQTATAEVLQVVNSSPGDLAPVFDAMLEKALRLCEAAYGNLLVFDGRSFSFASVQGDPDLVEHMRRREPFEPMPGTALSRIVDGEDVAHIADLLKSYEYHSAPQFRELVDIGGYRSLFEFALRKDKTLLGVIAIFRREARPFTDKQIALLQNFAAQAVIAMENARLLTETREALEQQTATAEVLQVINSSPGDLAPVFDAILDKARQRTGAIHGDLWTYDGECFHLVATHGEPGFSEWLRQQGPLRPWAGSGIERLLKGEDYVHLDDALQHNDFRFAPEFLKQTRIAGIRTVLTVPLRREGVVLGLITVYRREVRPFTDKQIALLQNFAAQAVIAMENARLLTETREALEQQTATAEVLQVINSSPGDLAPVFDAILEKAHALCGAANGGLLIRDGEAFRIAAFHGEPSFIEIWRQIHPGRLPEGAPLARIVGGERIVHITDALADESYRTAPVPIQRLLEGGAIRTLLMVPLRKDGTLLGVITAFRQEVRPFTDKQIALLENFAAQAVIAMENARLLDELHQRTDQVAELNRGLEARVAEQVEELGRVGRLKRFLAPQLAELIVSQGDEKILESHRREIVVVFCDLRGYTAFTETAEPEEVLDFLREYHGALGPLVSQFEGTLDQFSGDGIMVFFNDPVPIPDPARRAVNMAVAMREAAGTLIADWRERGRDLGFGAGIAQGYATLGQIGFSERSGYTAIGTVCNVAARLCAEAKDGQILLSQRINVALKGSVATEQVGSLAIKGLAQPVVAYNVPLAGSQAALRVIEGGTSSA